jgi:2-polyprenyl-3-methyl-5-hydroxy-6-metoxy-1,4-benzoquinol methylase
MDNSLLYDRDHLDNFEDLNNEHRKVIGWVGQNKKVLEFACHTGYVSKWLQKNGCTVTGAEIYEPALEKAKPYLHRAILGDVEKAEVWNEIAKESYDVVLLMHILEHLVSPETILKKVQTVLNPGGKIIVCLPNVSNWNERWAMFRGDFDYTDTGVMDRTHLKFYNYFTAQKLLIDNGYSIEEYCGDSWKVKFYILPRRRIFQSVNNLYNKLLNSIFGPNMTDQISMNLASFKNDE